MREINLQSEAVHKRLERDAKVKHFTVGDKPDNEYGEAWAKVIQTYLAQYYASAEEFVDLKVDGVTYGMLRREKDTVFYDENGGTLFDVENSRLESEYEQIGKQEETMNTECQEKDQMEETKEEFGDKKEIEPAVMENAASIKQRAKEKLEKELSDAEDKYFAEPVIGYLLERCAEDKGLAQDVTQKHKTWEKCLAYMDKQAEAQMPKKRTGVVRVAIRDEKVYEWAEDYYHKDDKAEEEEARKEAERKEQLKKEEAERAAKAKKKPAKTVRAPKKKADTPKEQSKPKKNNQDMEGQMDLFSMMGI